VEQNHVETLWPICRRAERHLTADVVIADADTEAVAKQKPAQPQENATPSPSPN
jgi:hypothetical protein